MASNSNQDEYNKALQNLLTMSDAAYCRTSDNSEWARGLHEMGFREN